MNLDHALLDYDLVLLAAIAERRGAEITASQQREAAAQLAEALLAPDSLQEVITWLSAEQRAALDALLAAGGSLPAARFGRRYGTVRRMGPGRLAREKPWRDPQNPVEALYYAGLVFFTFDEIAGQIVETAFVPDDLLPLLPPVEAEAEGLNIVTLSAPRVIRDSGRAFAEDLATLLACAEKGALYPRDLACLNERLMRPQEKESSRLALLLHQARALNLLELDGGKFTLQRPATREWLKADPPRQMLALQKSWRDDAEWNDLWRVPSLRPERTGWRNDPLTARARVLEHLSCCPTDEWIDLKSFVTAIKQIDPDFQRPPDAYNTWYIRDSGGEYLMGYEHWDRVEGALIAYLIGGPLYWLGVTALGFEDKDAALPSAFRLTAGGAFFLGLADQPPAEPSLPPLVMEADLRVRALAGGDLYDRFQLARIAEWQSSGEVFFYRLTRDSLKRTLNRGISLEQVLSFLRRITGDKVPPQAIETLRGWAGDQSQVRLIRAAVLEAKPASVMGELRARPDISSLLGEPISPTRSLVGEENWQELLARLRQAGYLPLKGEQRR